MNPLQLLWLLPVMVIVIAWEFRPNRYSERKPRKEEEPSQVKCETCKHKLDREDCQEIPLIGFHGKYELFYYCPLHKKPYDSVVWGNPMNGEHPLNYYKTIPAHSVEVDEEGREIKRRPN